MKPIVLKNYRLFLMRWLVRTPTIRNEIIGWCLHRPLETKLSVRVFTDRNYSYHKSIQSRNYRLFCSFKWLVRTPTIRLSLISIRLLVFGVLTSHLIFQTNHRLNYTIFRIKPVFKFIFYFFKFHLMGNVICWIYQTSFHRFNHMFKILNRGISTTHQG